MMEDGWVLSLRQVISAQVLAAATTILLTFSSIPANAAPYTFRNIIDTTTGLVFSGEPSLNDSGFVAFRGHVSGFGAGIFTSNGTTVKPIALGNNFSAAAWINNAGSVAFGQGGTPTSILLGDGTSTITIADNLTTFSGVGGTSVNDSGDVTFRADLVGGGQGIFVGDGITIKTIANTTDAGSPFGGPSINPLAAGSINEIGQVAFRANLVAGGGGIFLSAGTTTKTIADTSGQFSGFDSRFTVNDSGAVAFRAVLDTGGVAIVISDGNTMTWVADTNTPGSFIGLNDPVNINNSGKVAFEATYALAVIDGANVQLKGIYTGPDILADRVIGRGDPLFGSTVEGTSMSRGLNNRGEIAFEYFLENGTKGIAIASPTSIVAEPPATLTLFALGLLGLGVARRRKAV